MDTDKELFRGIARQYRKTVDSFLAFQKDCDALVRYASRMVVNLDGYRITCCLTREHALIFRFSHHGGTLTVPAVDFVEEFFRHGPVGRKALKRIAIK